jgi:sodium-dependent phosphate cotransporter
MTIGFTMVTYIALKIGGIIRFLLSNPFAALAIGIIATAIMQNATATTSIAVSMVGAGIISDVKSAIPIIMGSNIGTCVTNSFIALTMAGDPNEFKRAFSAATLNDGFNLLTTAVLLPIEIIFGFLDVISLAVTNAMLKGDNVSVDGLIF